MLVIVVENLSPSMNTHMTRNDSLNEALYLLNNDDVLILLLRNHDFIVMERRNDSYRPKTTYNGI